MKEIKFRMWITEKMIYGIEEIMKMLNQRGYKSQCMLFTGLRDKHDKEIYEGDILGGYPHGTAFVEWNNEYACFETVSYDVTENEEGNNEEIKHGNLLANDLQDCKDSWEVIGNIYENPELLKTFSA